VQNTPITCTMLTYICSAYHAPFVNARLLDRTAQVSARLSWGAFARLLPAFHIVPHAVFVTKNLYVG